MAKDVASQRAQREITAALHTGETRLNLSGYLLGREVLDKVPESLRQLTQLRWLDLSANTLETLPDWLGELSQLQTLNVRNNSLVILPESLGQLTNLRELDLSRNHVTLPKWLGGMTQLQSLSLNDTGMKTLPKWLGGLTQLRELDLSYNELKTLPERLGEVTQLRRLNISSNKLTKLPEWLGKAHKLESLNITGNNLKALPKGLGGLTQLRELNLSASALKTLPKGLGGLTQLRELNVLGSELTVLPDSLRKLKQLRRLRLPFNSLTKLPEWLGELTQLRSLDVTKNELVELPESLGQLTQLRELNLSYNEGIKSFPATMRQLTALKDLQLTCIPYGKLPGFIRALTSLTRLDVEGMGIANLPDWISELTELTTFWLGTSTNGNLLTDLPGSLSSLSKLRVFELESNPLNPELAAAYKDGLEAVKRYLRAKTRGSVHLNEAKLILIGEGEVGKSCLLGALRGDTWEEGRPTTHGIEIKPVKVTDPDTNTELTLNGWDFGGQRVYRPTHQLFFSAPAVYLVVWKPREGPQQGLVKDWIKLVKHREPEAKILVVATHGGPKERQPDIDRQEIWDLFGKGTVIDFFLVQSKPDEATGARPGIAELKSAIARVAASLPEMGRAFPQHWHEARKTLRGLLSLEVVQSRLGSLVRHAETARTRMHRLGENRLNLERAMEALGDLIVDEKRVLEELTKARVAYLSLDRVFAICEYHGVEKEDVHLLLRICRRVGDLIFFEHDPSLRDVVVLKPDWLATAMSFILDDEHTRTVGSGLISVERLGQLWENADRPPEDRYSADLHPIFLRLMERFDLCYRVSDIGGTDSSGTVLIAQLVPDVRPDPVPGWGARPDAGDEQQVQVCRIVETAQNKSEAAEGIFYQLIVRLHKYSLGRVEYSKSVHWQRGLVLQDNYGARAFLEHIANDIRITVRSPYPERFLSALTYEIKWLVESFWEGLRCEVTVPCIATQTNGNPCVGLFEVGKLLENKSRNRPEQPCPVCNEWQGIEQLLHNAPASRPDPLQMLLSEFDSVKVELVEARKQLIELQGEALERFDKLDIGTQRILSRVDDGFTGLMQSLNDEAKEGPRLFSFQPIDPGFFDRPKWMSQKFRLTLWCEHSRLPLSEFNDEDSTGGVYELTVPRDWFEKAAPFLKVLTGTLSLVLPIAASATKLMMDDVAYKGLEKELDLGQKSLDSALKGGAKSAAWLSRSDAPDLESGETIQAQGACLRQLHAWLKEKDPSFGGLVRVQNKRQEFLWVHPQFETEY